MKTAVLRENLNKNLEIVSRFASSKAQLPILSCIKILGQKETLTLQATNLEMSASITFGAKVEEDGEIAVPAKNISEVVANLNDSNLTLVSSGENLKIESQVFRSEMLGMNTMDFPKIPSKIAKTAFSLNVKSFCQALEKTLFAVSNDETRISLTGVLFLVKDKVARLVGTDGFRLSEVVLDGKVDTVSDISLIIPRFFLGEIVRLGNFNKSENIEMEIKAGTKQVIVADAGLVLSSRTIDGNFPDYQKIIPTNVILKVSISRDELVQNLKLASVFSRDSGNLATFKILGKTCVISAQGSSSGSQEASMDARVEGDAKGFEIIFNLKYLSDFVAGVKSPEVVFEFSGDSSAAILRDLNEPNYLHLVMPVKKS